jgi:hypothetical protein
VTTPIPFDESKIADKFWPSDPWDVNLPHAGFITDFILTLRGIKTPTKYQVWSALWLLSSLIKREARLEWGPLTFFFNLFVFLVGPPAIGKTTAIDWADENLLKKDFALRFEDRLLAEKKMPKIIHSKGTAEGIFQFLMEEGKSVEVTPGRFVKYKASNVAILTGELATFLGRQQYNVGLIERLTRLYDCASVDDEVTKGKGIQTVNEPYVTLLGGITPDGMAQSIPEASFGDGFLSRVIVVYQDEITRSYPYPRVVVGSPTRVELQERLAWIAANAQGTYAFSSEAGAAYVDWYKRWTKSMNDDSGLMRRAYSRYDIHAIKVAALIRASRYKAGTTIELQDWEDARRILDATFDESSKATEDVGADPVQKTMNLMESYGRKRGGIERKKFLQCYSGQGLKASILNEALTEFVQAGRLTIWETCEKEKKRGYPTNDGKEFYEITPNGSRMVR